MVQALTPHGASLRVSTTASAGGSRARLLCPRYGLPHSYDAQQDCIDKPNGVLVELIVNWNWTDDRDADRLRIQPQDPSPDALRPQGFRR